MIKKGLLVLLLIFTAALPLAAQDTLQNRAIFFIGYPGSGKGTQGKKIAKQMGVHHLSTGELFRAEAQKGTPIGKLMDSYMKRGEIIPSELTFEYLKAELSDPKYRSGFILDGYPKNMECCEFILQTLHELEFEPLIAFYFDITRDEVVRRLTGRLHCNGCETDFHKVFLPPKNGMLCDLCGSVLEARPDDTEKAIHQRLDVFEKNTKPVLDTFSKIGLLYKVDAAQTIDAITTQLIDTLNRKTENPQLKESSYFLRAPKMGEEKSSVFHNHIDAESQELLQEIIAKINLQSSTAQNKIYPITSLYLGPQTKDPDFLSVYSHLPNFHSIENATNEAFATGKMGDDGFDFEQVLITLETVQDLQGHRVMTELEEEIYEKEFNCDGEEKILLDCGFTPYAVDWILLPGWQQRLIDPIPNFEMHHGFDIPKLPGELTPPIDLANLMNLCSDNGFNNGGWFIFTKKDVWSYRTNEFSNDYYDSCLHDLNEQAVKLRKIVNEILPGRPFTSSCSLEKVHAIWKI